jgi:hypothetical protein
MNNFQEKLNQIEQELNLKEESNDLPIKANNGICNGNFCGCGRNDNLPNIREKEINKVERRNISMISAEAAKGDIIKLTEEAKGVTAIGAATVIVLRGILVLLKVLLTTRTNTVKLLDKLGIPRETQESKKEEPKQKEE